MTFYYIFFFSLFCSNVRSKISSSHHRAQLTCHKLKGPNYLQWSQSVMIFIYGHGREDYIRVETTLQNLKQGDLSVTTYYTTLSRYWQQLDLFETHEWKCSTDGALFPKNCIDKKNFQVPYGSQ